MEVITIEGVKYTKASQLAKQFKYTADYVGQLCRGKKVDAKLVGRTWYVNHLSLEDHKANRYSTRTDEEMGKSEETYPVKLFKQNVEAVVRKSTVRSLNYDHEPKSSAGFLKRVDWQPIKFESDETELIPAVNKASSAKRIKVDPAGAEPLKVKSDDKPFKIESDELPTVALGGEVKIRSIEDQYVDNSLESNAIFDSETVETTKIHIKNSDNERPVRVPGVSPRSESANNRPNLKSSLTITDETSLNFTPRRIRDTRIVQKSDVTTQREVKSTGYLRYLILTVFVIFLFIFTVSLESVLMADAQDFKQSFRLDFNTIFINPLH